MRRREFLKSSAAVAVFGGLPAVRAADSVGGAIHGRVTTGGRGLGRVVVSDGLQCVRTDATGAAFGGVGSAGGAVGFASGSTLLLGTDNTVGTLSLGGDVAVASGAALKVSYVKGSCSKLTAAGTVTLPNRLTVTALPTTAGMPFTGRVRLITAGTALVGPADFSEWSVVDENGTAIPGTLFRYSDDGKSVYLSRPLGIVIRLF